jgi:hypothetical protein
MPRPLTCGASGRIVGGGWTKVKQPSGIEAFREALNAQTGRTARSSLYRWLRANHDQFLEVWNDAADWPAFARSFSALGLTDRNGNAPAPKTARRTWLRVRLDVARSKEKKSKAALILAPGEIAPGVRAVSNTARAETDGPCNGATVL